MASADFFVISAALFAAAAFFISWLLSRRMPYPQRHATARRSAAAGIARSYKLALAPWARLESRSHLPEELANRFYARSFLSIHFHLGVFTAAILLLVSPVLREIPNQLSPFPGALLLFGLICGIALLIRRMSNRNQRCISIPDDYLASILVNLLILAAIAFVFYPPAKGVFQIIGGIVLVYAPVGKIRHMLFTLTSLRYLGSHFGRRGVRPQPSECGEAKR